jgi:hypothetical protein
MSYDIYFYKHREAQVSESDISAYLTNNLCLPNEEGNQWFFENENTEVYFSFDLNEPVLELEEPGDEYQYTHISFNLNFLRPDFFGQEAFLFVDKLIQDLGLYIDNPQDDGHEDYPRQPKKGELYKNWSEINAQQSARFYEELELSYYPLSASNKLWQHNFNKEKLQAELGEEYFVPRVLVLQALTDKRIITLAIWPENLPILVPDVDYFLLVKKYKRLGKKVEEVGLISVKTFYANFGEYLSNLGASKVIRPAEAGSLRKQFNSIELEGEIAGFAEKMPFEKMVNAIPKADESGLAQKTTTDLA